ncbi:MAG: TIGR04086 family membrane protein [Lachnospiraceae bacterium]|nr:TIGR04086 family membrane protein [Lachnospiraceae bacterium]MBR4061354.1 TIGR04086 family membrane protein [Lachnospiraceae bacterium]
MQQNRSRNNQLTNNLKLFLITTLTAILITAVLLILSAFLLEKMGLSEGQVQIVIYIIYLLSALAAGLIAGKMQREKKFMWGALAGLVWFVVVLIISIILNNMAVDASGLFPAVVCMVGGGMLGGMLA